MLKQIQIARNAIDIYSKWCYNVKSFDARTLNFVIRPLEGGDMDGDNVWHLQEMRQAYLH